mgnify:CR=1 FL=1
MQEKIYISLSEIERFSKIMLLHIGIDEKSADIDRKSVV